MSFKAAKKLSNLEESVLKSRAGDLISEYQNMNEAEDYEKRSKSMANNGTIENQTQDMND